MGNPGVFNRHHVTSYQDDGSQGTDVPTPGNAENEPPEKEGLSPSQRTTATLDPTSPAPGEGPSGRKRRRAPRGGASLTPELAPVQVGAEGWGQGVVRILGWALRDPGLGRAGQTGNTGLLSGRIEELENQASA